MVTGNMHVTNRSQTKNVGTAKLSNTEEDVFVTWLPTVLNTIFIEYNMHSSEHFVSRLNLLRNLIIKVQLFHLHDWQFLPDIVIGHLQVALRSLVSQNPPFSHRNPTHNVFSLEKYSI